MRTLEEIIAKAREMPNDYYKKFWHKGHPVMVRKFVHADRQMGNDLWLPTSAREVWKRAKFERWDGNCPVVLWSNGMLEKLPSSEDVR